MVTEVRRLLESGNVRELRVWLVRYLTTARQLEIDGHYDLAALIRREAEECAGLIVGMPKSRVP